MGRVIGALGCEGVALHGAIMGAWLLSRTVGLTVVHRSEDPAPVGVADVTANVFSFLVIVASTTASPLDDGHRADNHDRG